ncbi:MAG: hypothetical protein ABI626_00275 [Sphingomicrobium sp.]
MGRTIAIATLIAGTLDILFAMILTLIFGRHIPDMLRFVASGPFPAATDMGISGAILGLVVHYALMAVMTAVFVAAANHKPALTAQPIKWGVIYGLVTYVVINLVVVPLRFGNWPPKPLSIATQLFAHIVLVGIPIALITARNLRARTA